MNALKLALEKFEILKAMNLLVKSMNNEDAYDEWICTIPDQAGDEELMEIAADEDESVYCEACHDFRRICDRYLCDGIYVGGFPDSFQLYGAGTHEGDEDDD